MEITSLKLLLVLFLSSSCYGESQCTGAGLPVYMSWSSMHDMTNSDLITIDSIFYNYPKARIVVLVPDDSTMLVHAMDHLNILSSMGYCINLTRYGDIEIRDMISLTLPAHVIPHFYIYYLQSITGGLYVPFGGALLNTLDYVTSFPELGGKQVVFVERIADFDSKESLRRDEYVNMTWKRSPWKDTVDGRSFVCSIDCVRFLPEGWMIGIDALVNSVGTTHPDVILTRTLRKSGELWSSMFYLLPYWLLADEISPDQWTRTIRSGQPEPNDLQFPREGRYRYDYWLTVSSKLWLPWPRGTVF
jgi:hypothetical protein